MAEEKRCTKCGIVKAIYEFHWSSYMRKDGIRLRISECKSCHNERGRKWSKENPDKDREHSNRWRAKNKDKARKTALLWQEKARFSRALNSCNKRAAEIGYAPCIATVEQISAAFTGYCAMCGTKENERRLHMDHDHATGMFRWWLCGKCNSMIGFSGDSPELLEKAATELRKLQEARA